jgi:hypothetical protein
MKLALLDSTEGANRLGVVSTGPDGDTVVDVTAALPWPHDPDPLTAGWWRALCRDFAEPRPALENAAVTGPPVPVSRVV